ncbi:MAG: hypothetical protein HYZ73_02360 [Elusimicrobia bacterium]|nr:hypothetical protein [Elusimicrobiota bacterium]
MLILATMGFTSLEGIVIGDSYHGLGVFNVTWLLVFGYLIFNVAFMLLHTTYALFINYTLFKERYLTEIPRTAIVYFLRKESSGLYERMEYTFRCNYLDNVDLWIVTGEAEEKYLSYEMDVLHRLRKKFGDHRVQYFHSDNPTKRKREMMELWLDEYSNDYKYFIPCDADSLLPINTVLKLLRKAEHPENRRIAVFQTSIEITNAHTYYSRVRINGCKLWMNSYVQAMTYGIPHI